MPGSKEPIVNNKIPFLTGVVSMQSELELEVVGKILSKILFGGLEFGGKEEAIHEETPAIYINATILGLAIVLDGYAGMGEETWYNLYIYPVATFRNKETEECRIGEYLLLILEEALQEYPEIVLMEEDSI